MKFDWHVMAWGTFGGKSPSFLTWDFSEFANWRSKFSDVMGMPNLVMVTGLACSVFFREVFNATFESYVDIKVEV